MQIEKIYTYRGEDVIYSLVAAYNKYFNLIVHKKNSLQAQSLEHLSRPVNLHSING